MRDEGSAVAGLNYSLFCEVTIPMFSGTTGVSEAFILWTYPSGETQYALGNSVQLLFSPLTSDDEGVYTCTAHYLVNGIASPQGSSDYHVTFSKSVSFCTLHNFVSCVWIFEQVIYIPTSDLYTCRSWRSVNKCDRLWIRRSWFSLHSHLHSHTPPQS